MTKFVWEAQKKQTNHVYRQLDKEKDRKTEGWIERERQKLGTV